MCLLIRDQYLMCNHMHAHKQHTNAVLEGEGKRSDWSRVSLLPLSGHCLSCIASPLFFPLPRCLGGKTRDRTISTRASPSMPLLVVGPTSPCGHNDPHLSSRLAYSLQQSVVPVLLFDSRVCLEIREDSKPTADVRRQTSCKQYARTPSVFESRSRAHKWRLPSIPSLV